MWSAAARTLDKLQCTSISLTEQSPKQNNIAIELSKVQFADGKDTQIAAQSQHPKPKQSGSDLEFLEFLFDAAEAKTPSKIFCIISCRSAGINNIGLVDHLVNNAKTL